MNVRFERTGRTRVDDRTHTIVAEGTYVTLGGIYKRSGEMYEARDHDSDTLIARVGTATRAQAEARVWYGNRDAG